jgi:hypothetical protein
LYALFAKPMMKMRSSCAEKSKKERRTNYKSSLLFYNMSKFAGCSLWSPEAVASPSPEKSSTCDTTVPDDARKKTTATTKRAPTHRAREHSRVKRRASTHSISSNENAAPSENERGNSDENKNRLQSLGKCMQTTPHIVLFQQY